MKTALIYLSTCAVIILLPLIFNTTINNTIKNSSDMQTHIAVIQSDNNTYLYFGEIITRYLFKPIAHQSWFTTFYLYGNYFVLIGIVSLLYYMAYKMVGQQTAYIIVPMALFMSAGILWLFKYGVVYNLVNVYLILTATILFLVKWFSGGKWWNLMIAMIGVLLYSVFHVSALYLPFVATIALICYVIYALIKKQKKYILKVVIVGVSIIVLNVVTVRIAIPNANNIVKSELINNVNNTAVLNNTPNTSEVSPVGNIYRILSEHISLFTIVVLVLAIGFCVYSLRNSQVTSKEKLILYIYSCFAVALFGGYLLRVNQDYNRLMVDGATMIAITTALLAGMAMKYSNSMRLKVAVYILCLFGVMPNLILWVK